MIDEHRIEQAAKFGLGKIEPSPDLLDRINRQVGDLDLGTAAVRPSIWSRLRLGPKVELALACVVLVGLVGVAAYRNLHSGQVPAGGDTDSSTQGTSSEVATRRVYSGEGNDGTVRVQVVLSQQENGAWSAVSTISNVSKSVQVELKYECNNLIRLDGSLIKADCAQALPSIILSPGESKNEELALDGKYQGTPTIGWLAYSIRSEGKKDPVRTLNVPLQEGVRQCCSEPNWSAADVVAKFEAVGLDTKLNGELSTKLFGARQVQSISAEGENVVVYEFGTAANAQNALKSIQDPQANTVDWVGRPQFFQMGNLVVQIDFGNERVAQKLKDALSGVAESPGPSSTTQGAGDLILGGMQATFSSPVAPAKITPDQAQETTVQHIGPPPADTKVTTEYVMMTLPAGTFGRDWVNYPVYLITYDGVELAPTGPVPQGPAPTPKPGATGKITAIIDANTGDWIMAVAR